MIGFLNRLIKSIIKKRNQNKSLQEISYKDLNIVPIKIKQNVFFSYGHDDNTELVFRLKSDLEKRGHTVWIDTANIKSGEDWRRRITEGLTSSSQVLSFLSKHSVRSPGVCLDELRIALSVKRSYIKTILLEKEEEVQPPTTLLNIQWLDMSEWKEVKCNGKSAWQEWYIKVFTDLCSIIESDEAYAFKGEIQRLLELLRPSLSDTKEQSLLNIEYVGRVWLENKLEQWRTDKNNSKAFVLLGGPGVGKSSFVAHLLHYNHNILCGIFCEWDKNLKNDAKSIFCTLSFKIATKLPDYRKILLEKLDGVDEYVFERMNASEYFDALLVQPLNELIDGGRERQIIFIDGLDEAKSSGGRNEVAEILADNLFKLPSWIILLLTSRPEYNIHLLFSSYNPFVLNPVDKHNLEDIRKYIVYALADELATIEDRLFILEAIVQKCKGNFLYASLFIESVKSHMINLTDIENYPSGLDAFYFQNFRRKFQDMTNYQQIRSFLEILSACQYVPTMLVNRVLRITIYEISDFLSIFGSLIQETTLSYNYTTEKIECLSFYHKSLADWLGDRNKAGVYYIDSHKGYRRLVDYCLDYVHNYGKDVIEKPSQYFVGKTPILEIDILDDYIKTKMPEFFVNGKFWDKYQKFLLEEDTPLIPYWNALKHFPKSYDFTVLINRLWSDFDRLNFFKNLQRIGESQLILMLIEHFIDVYGLKRLDIQTLNIYIDIVHLSGDYQKSVHFCENYLSQYNDNEIYNTKELLYLNIRRLHHSMFYAPVDNLIKDACDIEKKINKDKFPSEFNELLFLIGGNLGMLHGDFTYARQYLERSLDFARKYNYFDYESRTVRKYADLLCVEEDLDKAYELVSHYVSYNGDINSRYQIYLLGTMGEIFRRKGEFEKALKCFTLIEKNSEQRGIIGWKAHSLLAIANLFLTKGYLEDAKSSLKKAESIYKEIDQKWGMIQVEIIRYGILLYNNKDLSSNDKNKLNLLLNTAKSMQYLRDVDVIKQLQVGKFPRDFQLLFL